MVVVFDNVRSDGHTDENVRDYNATGGHGCGLYEYQWSDTLAIV